MGAEFSTREEWLTKLADLMRDTLFTAAKATFVDEYRISVGWTTKRKAIGECWAPQASAKAIERGTPVCPMHNVNMVV